jgi:alkaline phosphatase
MKNLYVSILLLAVACVSCNDNSATAFQQGKAKYVFYFIGDGMGLNQVNATEMYLAATQENRIGVKPLLFTQFPVASFATSYSASNPITDSAAAGTALATGVKTYNHAISFGTDSVVLKTVAERAKAAGRRVGITTSVSVDHATPSVFYAHKPDRSMYYEIACSLPATGFDFFAGAGFLKPETDYYKNPAPSIYPIIEQGGYTIARGYADYKAKAAAADKMVLIQDDKAQAFDAIPYAIDRKTGDLSLTEITTAAIDFLSKDLDKGFFLMVEAGKIDWSCHANDPATTFQEVIDLDNAVKVAYEFYQKYPKETLIVVTADHETGGFGLGVGSYTMNLGYLAGQKCSEAELTQRISALRQAKGTKTTWADVKQILTESMGFWTKVPVTTTQEDMLISTFNKSFSSEENAAMVQSLYSEDEPLAAAAIAIMNRQARLGWTTGSHSAAYVPIFAVGSGSELFNNKMDNTDIPKRIAKAAGYEW